MASSDQAVKEPASFCDCFIGYDECDPQALLFDARHVQRAAAIRHVADDYGIEFRDAKCRVVYCRWLSRQERWDNTGAERWLDEQDEPEEGGPETYPDEPPAEWEPDDYDWAFETCSKDAPGAVKCWQVECPR